MLQIQVLEYTLLTHKTSGKAVSPGNANPGGVWRLLLNSAYFDNDNHVTDLRLVFVGTPSPSDWKKLPESSQKFGEFAAKVGLRMARLDSVNKVLTMVKMDRKDDPNCRFVLLPLSYSPP